MNAPLRPNQALTRTVPAVATVDALDASIRQG